MTVEIIQKQRRRWFMAQA